MAQVKISVWFYWAILGDVERRICRIDWLAG
jgi:hypothetical protein